MNPAAGPPACARLRLERSADLTVSNASGADPVWSATDQRAVDLIRVLAMDAVEQAGSGHPGTAMSLAPAAYLLFQRILRHDPADPQWLGRDRFVLSCGHSSLTLYLQLYLSGYGLTLDDIAHYRTWGSRTPGHPEHGLTAGVETTTGPLGQGIANAVGMAMAARRERGLLDPDAAPGASPFDHHIYAFASDGDIEEGISHEASSLAAHQQLGNLILLYDDNYDLDRGRHQHRQVRGRRRPLRGLRLARAAGLLADGRGLPRGRRDPGRGVRERQEQHRPAVVHRAADDHRLASARCAEHRRGARRGARRRRGGQDQARPGLRPGGELPRRGRGCRARPQGGRPGQEAARRVGGVLRGLAGAQPGAGGAARPAVRPAAARRAGPRYSPSSRRTPRAWRPAGPLARF